MSGQQWWRGAVIYQVYPRSFLDTNGDGVGDLPGIVERLDYIASLGVDAIWISPFFKSPMADFGYDIADYRDVDPLFGSLADFDRLLRDAPRRSRISAVERGLPAADLSGRNLDSAPCVLEQLHACEPDAGPEEIEGRHGDPEAGVDFAQQLVGAHEHTVELPAPDRMRRQEGDRLARDILHGDDES